MNKLVKLKYLPNNFEIIEERLCRMQYQKKIHLENLNY